MEYRKELLKISLPSDDSDKIIITTPMKITFLCSTCLTHKTRNFYKAIKES